MDKKLFSAGLNINAALTAVAFVVTAFCIITGSYIRNGYDIEVGAASGKKFKAPREILNSVATERLRYEAEQSVTPLYVHDPAVKSGIFAELSLFFGEIDKKRAEYMPILIPGEALTANGDVSLDKSQLGIKISDDQLVYLVTAFTPDYISLSESVYSITESMVDTGIKEELLPKALQSAGEELSRTDLMHSAQDLAMDIISGVLAPNLVIDEEATERERREKMNAVEPVYLQSGQTIVDEGEIVTEEAYAILEALGYVNLSLAKSLLLIFGALIYTALLFAVALIFIYFYHDKMLNSPSEKLLLFTLYVLTVILARAMAGLPFYFIPVLLFAVLSATLVSFRLSLVLNLCVTLVAALICNGDMTFIMYFLINGAFACLMARYIITRNRAFSVAGIMSGMGALTVIAAHLLFENGFSKGMADGVVYSVLGALLTVIISLGSLPFWEFTFGVVTAFKLLDLINPNRPLLRRLIIEAPGTYHHSLIVANLAETAAFDVGANHILTRVGGYYHDIGKMKYPQYFSENQIYENPHDTMEPAESVRVITSHVDYGMKLADEHNLPDIIREFIERHHGSSMIKYFYFKAQKEDADVCADDYRYKHLIPRTRETAIVMLADTIEAAVRSMAPSGKAMDEVETFVRALIKDKLDDGQLSDSGLTIKDLDTVTKSFMRVFKGMYHERIAYPKETTKELTERSGD